MVGTRLRFVRNYYGDTQKQTAEILKITQQQYGLYENNQRQIPVDKLKIFCKHYKISADYLLNIPKNYLYPNL